MTPVAWVRNFAKFSWTFMFGNFLIVVVVITFTILCIIQIVNFGIDPTVVGINHEGLMPMLGFAIYSFEGIGVVMPIMQRAENP